MLHLEEKSGQLAPIFGTLGVSQSASKQASIALRRPSLVASLHLEGPSHDCGRETRFWSRWLACRFTSPEVGAVWFSADGWLGRRPPGAHASARRWVRHGFKVSRFPDFWPYWGGDGHTPHRVHGMCQFS